MPATQEAWTAVLKVKTSALGRCVRSAKYNIYDHNGTIIQRAEDVPKGKPAAGADVPRVDAPKVDSPATAKIPERELAGVAGIRLSSGTSHPLHIPDHAPTGHPDLTPGGTAGHGPTNNLDNTPRGGHPDGSPPGGTHPDTPSAAGHPDTPSGTGHTDATGTGGAGHDAPPAADTHLPDNPGAGGMDDAAHASDDAAGAGAHDGEEPLTAERRKELQDKHVWLANNDEAWRSTHYNTLNRRRSVATPVDGVELPQLTKDANGKLISVHDLPNGPRETRLAPEPFKLDTVPEGNLPELNKAMGDRRVSVNLTNAEVKLKEGDSQAARDAVAEARKAFDKRLPGVPNNSKIPENLGNKAAVLHVIPEAFPQADIIHLPKTPNGANMFDGAYKLPDDWRLIVEEKAPPNGPEWRQGKPDPDPLDPTDLNHGGAQGMRVQQGTRQYIRTILAEMKSRGGKDAEIATDLRAALKAGRLKYVLVKAKEDLNGNGEYAGATLEEFLY
ncbi:hypothetical protein [Streptomyces sp. NPDC002209]|uniref:hypothetical protein n=1 Tax=Streptomyces sp. NPDC002209 TaxID=3364638 RepID=UPI003673D086